MGRAGVQVFEILQRFVNYQEVFESWSGARTFGRQRNDDLCVTSFERPSAARVIDQYPAHLPRRYGEEVRPVLPLDRFAGR